MANNEQKGKSMNALRSLKTKKLSQPYAETYDKLTRHLYNQKMDAMKLRIVLDKVFVEFQEADAQQRDVSTLVGKDFKKYLSKVEKSIDYKEEHEKYKTGDYEKYVICGLWYTMCAYIVLLFIKEFLNQNYLIAFSIDVLVAIIAFYIGLHNVRSQYNVLKSYHLKFAPIYLQISSFFCGILIVWISLSSPFDVSFLLLVIAYLMSKHQVKKAFSSYIG